MTPHFSLTEFTASQTATRRGIDNRLPERFTPNARNTLLMMERIRAALTAEAGTDVPIIISSGYRSASLNRAVGGSPTSDHTTASAVDWTAPKFGTPFEIASYLAPRADDLQLGQLIHEFGAWVHTSTRVPSRAINRVITITHAGIAPGVRRA